MRPTLSAEECRKADRFYLEEHAQTFICAHAILRTILASYMGSSPSSIEFGKLPGGKPNLKGCEHLHFSLSHSGDMVLIAVALGREVGIDVEVIRPLPDLEDIARSFFAPGERDDLLGLAPDERVPAFFNCWTRKEAFVKAIGTGLLHPLDSFRVTLLPAEPAAFVTIGDAAAGHTQWSLHDIRPAPGYAAALAVEARDVSVHSRSFDSITECLSYFSPPA
ncbi:MAG: 4'-phosphopantetheinyl transferase superfamily protein [Candidatus Solibacter sp.]